MGDDMNIFELARQCIKNNRAISSNLARLLSEWILKHEPKPEVQFEDTPADEVDTDDEPEVSDE